MSRCWTPARSVARRSPSGPGCISPRGCSAAPPAGSGWGAGCPCPCPRGALAAARYIVSGPPKKLFSFALAEESLRRLGQATEAFLMTQQERGFRTLDYYKQLERSLPEAGRG